MERESQQNALQILSGMLLGNAPVWLKLGYEYRRSGIITQRFQEIVTKLELDDAMVTFRDGGYRYSI